METNSGRTIYTDEMVKNARYNVQHYDWGKKLLKKLKEQADFFKDNFETIYDLLPPEGIPRSYKISTFKAQDDVKCHCPSCGINVDSQYGEWEYDPIHEPWKLWCPHCGSKFPTNDFGLLYKRGLDENGEYNRELAHKNNKIAVSHGEKDALVNELYPEQSTTWMVDDGFGWSPSSKTYGTKDMIQYAPVAKYVHMLWSSAKNYNMRTILSVLRDYYLYTGDKDYGRAGVIILDRIADLYPTYDINKVALNYHNAHGGGYSGNALGSITEYYLTENLVRCFDAFRPMFDDEKVIAFLSHKAEKLGLKNPKTNGDLVRKNLEDGILYAVWNGLQNASIRGNFGLHQKVAALTAVALDRQPETDEILEWMCAPHKITYATKEDPVFGGEYQCQVHNSGGEFFSKYVNEVDRDGFGGEISIGYNHYWYNGVIIASILKNYGKSKLDLYANPKVRRMFDTFVHMTVGHGYSLLPGDGGILGSGKLITFTDDMALGYHDLHDPQIAQIFHLYAGGKIDSAKIGCFYDIQEMTNSMEADIAQYGEYKLESENLTGYGLAVVRGGENTEEKETRYDNWMFYGRTLGAHAHLDMLHMGIDAYGFNFTPDLANPEFKGRAANRHEWVRNTISHNAVAVNGRGQKALYTGTPLHFDSTERVKLIDVECSDAYDETDIYRRTLVSVAANEDVSYTLDFFRVKGGCQHTYSFHSQSYMGYTQEGLETIPQVDESGKYVGTYAGADVPFGPDPNSKDDDYAVDPKYTRGYTWLENVNRGSQINENGHFNVNFKQSKFLLQGPDASDLNMKFHGLNDWKADSVDIVTGYAPRVPLNKTIPGLDYMFIQRTGKNLDTLFVNLLEPYKGESYIWKTETCNLVVKDGTMGQDDVAKAVKVVLNNGRTDYVIYASNRDVTYQLTDDNVCFVFKGFLGVYSVDSTGKNIYSYINDGVLIGEQDGLDAYTGMVVDFTKELQMDDYIVIKADQNIEDLSILENQYIYVDNKGAKCNGAYRIRGAKREGEHVVLSLGNCTLIECCVDDADLDKGFLYTIAEGQAFRIPLRNEKIYMS